MSQDRNKTEHMKKSLDPSFLKKTPVPTETDKAVKQDTPMTTIYMGNVATEDTTPVKEFMSDPVVGWVVIIQGPGKGISLPLGNGNNSIGRGNNQRVVLDFGDASLSRDSHAIITYDPRGRQFYLRSGDGSTNLTYLDIDGQVTPVLMPTALLNGQCILVGSTTLKFIALCGIDFGWDTRL